MKRSMKRSMFIIPIAVAIGCIYFMTGFDAISHPHPFHITEIGPENGQNEADAPADHTGYVKTNRPFHGVSWYVNGDHFYSTLGSNNQDTSYVYLSGLDGDVWGRKYIIEAKVWGSDDPEFPYANSNLSDSDAYLLRVYKPEVDSGVGPNTGVSGEARIDIMTYDSGSMVLTTSYSVNASNSTEAEVEVDYTFLLEVTDLIGDVLYSEIDFPGKQNGRRGGRKKINLPAGEDFNYSNDLSIDLSGEWRNIVHIDATNNLDVSGDGADSWSVGAHPSLRLRN